MKRPVVTIHVAALTMASVLSHAHASSISIGAWSPIFQGVSETTATVDQSVAYGVRIDLDAPGIGFTTTPHGGPSSTIAQTTSQFLTSSGAQVAINADFFDPCCNAAAEPKNLESLAISNGTLVAPAAAGTGLLLLTQANAATITTAGASTNLSGVYNAVSGSSVIVDHGQNVAPSGGSFNGANPRSDAGVSQDGRYLYLVAIDGRQAYSVGATLLETADLLIGLGAYDALNLDGGGSTALAVSDGAGGATVLNRPSGGAERYDGNNLGVFAAPLPEPAGVLALGCGLLGLGLARRR